MLLENFFCCDFSLRKAFENLLKGPVQHIPIEDDNPLRLPPKLQRAGKTDHSSSSLVAQHAVGRESIASCKGELA